MLISKLDYEKLKELEESLWKSKTRFNLEYQEKVFAPDFFEFGRSGKTYTREQMIRTSTQPIRAKLPLNNFKINLINESTALVTYISEVQYETMELANRSSIWSRTGNYWQLRFHQGTPIFKRQ